MTLCSHLSERRKDNGEKEGLAGEKTHTRKKPKKQQPKTRPYLSAQIFRNQKGQLVQQQTAITRLKCFCGRLLSSLFHSFSVTGLFIYNLLCDSECLPGKQMVYIPTLLYLILVMWFNLVSCISTIYCEKNMPWNERHVEQNWTQRSAWNRATPAAPQTKYTC